MRVRASAGAIGLVSLWLSGCASLVAHRDVPVDRTGFSRWSDPEAKFDWYEPRATKGERGRPALLAIHGGAWIGGDRSEALHFAETLCGWGYVIFAFDYRLAPAARWPAQLEDCRSALDYVRAHADQFGIDPSKVGVIGASAGAHLATMLELRDYPRGQPRPKLAIAIDGQSDMVLGELSETHYDELMASMFGHPAPWTHAELRDLSTVPFARQDCSILLVHGANDPNVFVINSDELDQALIKKRADVEYVRLEGAEGDCHAACWTNPKALAAMHAFLDRRLK